MLAVVDSTELIIIWSVLTVNFGLWKRGPQGRGVQSSGSEFGRAFREVDDDVQESDAGTDAAPNAFARGKAVRKLDRSHDVDSQHRRGFDSLHPLQAINTAKTLVFLDKHRRPMLDAFTKAKGSEVMSRLPGRGNKVTEIALAKMFRAEGITGWRRHTALTGKPNFAFSERRVVVFVDGCVCDYAGNAEICNSESEAG